MKALWLALLMTLGCAASAVAEAPLDVARTLRGRALLTHVAVLEDPTHALNIDQVSAAAQRDAFHSVRKLAFGFSQSAYWMRVAVRNSSPRPRAWLMEVGFPQLDYVTLYVPDAQGGYASRESGDMVPFEQRDLSYRNVVFMLEQPARSEQVYYLRVVTRGLVNVPLTAWSLEQFAEHQHLDWAGLCVFYGIILMTACYNLSLWVFTRDRENLYFATFVLCMGFFQVTIVGHTFEFVLAHHNDLAQVAVPFSIALAMLSVSLLGRCQLDSLGMFVSVGGKDRRVLERLMYLSIAIVLFSVFGPFRWAIRVVPVFTVGSSIVAFVMLWRLMRRAKQKSSLYVWGWSCILLGVAVALLDAMGVMPSLFITHWSAQIGSSLQFVLVSAGMAAKLKWLRVELHDTNLQLEREVMALEHAVVRTEQATARAERALRVKDEFVATMSHELRTPLNTIINVPQGLVEDFPLQRYAACASCHAHFELDPDELVSAETRCPECYASNCLELHELASYTGQPARTMRYLETIERSGKHLLQVVNGILRSERTDQGDGELSYAVVETGRLVRDVVDEMSEWAERSGVALVVRVPSEPLDVAMDALRVRQVLLNLIGNAIKFSNGRGTVTVTLRAEAGGCAMAVRDEGIGIAADKLETVFDSYQQAHDSETSSFGGTGLGLPISRELVRRHGGELQVESELGQGATFTFTIPRAQSMRRSA